MRGSRCPLVREKGNGNGNGNGKTDWDCSVKQMHQFSRGNETYANHFKAGGGVAQTMRT